MLHDDAGNVAMFFLFSFEDESFIAMDAPQLYPGSDYELFRLAELQGS
jgi:hypothetical protein